MIRALDPLRPAVPTLAHAELEVRFIGMNLGTTASSVIAA
jgi:hypothetical protein